MSFENFMMLFATNPSDYLGKHVLVSAVSCFIRW